MQLGLLGRPRFYDVEYGSKFEIQSSSLLFNEDGDMEGGNATNVTAQLTAKLNKFIADVTVNKGRHCFPFFVRYALRMYDGSLSMASAPILMNPSTGGSPVITYTRTDEDTNAHNVNIMLMASSLLYRMLDGTVSDYANWKDLVKSVDIFISAPIYTYDQSGKVRNFGNTKAFSSKFIGKLYCHGHEEYKYEEIDEPGKSRIIDIENVSSDALVQGSEGRYQYQFLNDFCEWTYASIYALYYNKERSYPAQTVRLTDYDDAKLEEEISNVGNFYLLKSIPVDELTEKETEIVTPDDYLQSLVNRERLADDYQSHDTLVPQKAFMYNSRLNLAMVKKRIFGGFPSETMFARCNAQYSTNYNGGIYMLAKEGLYSDSISVFAKYEENGNTFLMKENSPSAKKICSSFFSDGTDKSAFAWMYHPSPNIKKFIVCQNQNQYEITAKTHPFLNGSYAFTGFDKKRAATAYGTPANEEAVTIKENIIYTSESENPFVFPPQGVNAIGTVKVLGMASATKAISEGQYGQFPLYAFTSEGVWSLSVSDSGLYAAKQPVVMDVCIGNGESITNLDSSVVFASKRGIMLLSGGNSVCLSDWIKSNAPFNASSLKGLSDTAAGIQIHSIKPFDDFLNGCRMIYDYNRQRLIVYNPEKDGNAKIYPYAYVYSFLSKKWGIMDCTIEYSLNSYPDAIAVENGGISVVDESEASDTETVRNGIIVTRPIKLEGTDQLKTISTLIQRGRIGNVKQILYGSRDMTNWIPVWSSRNQFLRGFRGTPYKYFRVAVIFNLKEGESLYGCSVEYDVKMNNRLR
jgi:hypothetical protein